MTHMRYWAMSTAVAAAGAFIAVDRFAFAPSRALWIAFAVAIGAAVLSLAATAVGLLRDNVAFSGTSAVSALVAGGTILATRVFVAPSALWLAFAGGLALLLLSLRALALHETTVERVVHALELNGAGEPLALRAGSAGSSRGHRARGGLEIAGAMRSWLYWLAHTAIALAGAFVVLTTFAWPHSVPSVSPRWLAFGVGIAVTAIALVALVDRALPARGQAPGARIAAMLVTAASAATGAALVVLMTTLHGVDARWWAFGLGAALAGVSLAASTIHELSSERVRHELEVAHTGAPVGQATVARTP